MSIEKLRVKLSALKPLIDKTNNVSPQIRVQAVHTFIQEAIALRAQYSGDKKVFSAYFIIMLE